MKRWPKQIKVWGLMGSVRGWTPIWSGMLVADDERVYVLETKPKKRKRRKAGK